MYTWRLLITKIYGKFTNSNYVYGRPAMLRPLVVDVSLGFCRLISEVAWPIATRFHHMFEGDNFIANILAMQQDIVRQKQLCILQCPLKILTVVAQRAKNRTGLLSNQQSLSGNMPICKGYVTTTVPYEQGDNVYKCTCRPTVRSNETHIYSIE